MVPLGAGFRDLLNMSMGHRAWDPGMEMTEVGHPSTKIYKGKVTDRKMWSNWDLDSKIAREWWVDAHCF